MKFVAHRLAFTLLGAASLSTLSACSTYNGAKPIIDRHGPMTSMNPKSPIFDDFADKYYASLCDKNPSVVAKYAPQYNCNTTINSNASTTTPTQQAANDAVAARNDAQAAAKDAQSSASSAAAAATAAQTSLANSATVQKATQADAVLAKDEADVATSQAALAKSPTDSAAQASALTALAKAQSDAAAAKTADAAAAAITPTAPTAPTASTLAGQRAKAFAIAGFAAVKANCADFFRQAGRDQQLTIFGTDSTNFLNTTASSVLTLGRASSRAMAGSAAGFGFLSGSAGVFSKDFFLNSDNLDSVRGLVLDALDTNLAGVNAKPSNDTYTFYDAKADIEEAQSYCTHNGILTIIAKSLKSTSVSPDNQNGTQGSNGGQPGSAAPKPPPTAPSNQTPTPPNPSARVKLLFNAKGPAT